MPSIHRLLLVTVVLGALTATAFAQDCSSGFDPACPSLIFAATVTTPICPNISTWDDETASCWLPCSSLNTIDTVYTHHEEDMGVCVPTCPQGTLPKPGVDGFSTVCLQCPSGSPIVSGKKGNWVCRRGGQTTLPIRSITVSHQVRQKIDGGCPAGSSFVNGVCASCTGSCDNYLQATSVNATSARQYMFWQAEGATFCVPDQCCISDSELIEGGGCASGDCDENDIDYSVGI